MLDGVERVRPLSLRGQGRGTGPDAEPGETCGEGERAEERGKASEALTEDLQGRSLVKVEEVAERLLA